MTIPPVEPHPAEPNHIRDTLFGDMTAMQWPRGESTDEPWASFVRARNATDSDVARKELESILAMPDLEPRHYLQAWSALRDLGVEPPEAEVKRVLGVVVEVALEEGLDIVGAYADRSARYFNYSGRAVIWERPDESLDPAIDDLLAAGQSVADAIGPWLDPRPPAPVTGNVRISMLTPSGIHFGEGPFEALAADELGGPPIAAAARLMAELIDMSERR